MSTTNQHKRNETFNKLLRQERNESGVENKSMLRYYKTGAILAFMGVLCIVLLFLHDGSTSTNVRGSAETERKILGSSATTEADGLIVRDEEETEGKVISFTLSNLDGEEGRVGKFLVRTRPSWSPLGAERLEALVRSSFWTDCRFFRVVPNFMAQFGINGDPVTQRRWRGKSLKDDPVTTSNKRGTITFATSGKNTRTTQLFINYKDNKYLDHQGFAPVAEILGDGMDVVDRIYNGYREKPNQGLIQNQGNQYLNREFPKLTYIVDAQLVDSVSNKL